MDEEGFIIDAGAPATCEAAQLCQSMINIAAQVDVTRDLEARNLLITTMKAVAYALNPPQGKVREFKSKK